MTNRTTNRDKIAGVIFGAALLALGSCGGQPPTQAAQPTGVCVVYEPRFHYVLQILTPTLSGGAVSCASGVFVSDQPR